MTELDIASSARRNTISLLITSLVIAATVCLPHFASAQNKAAAGKQGGKKTAVDFTDQLVEGKADKPELFYLLQQRNANNKRLIRLRENFLPEMKRSAEDVGRASRSRGRGN